MAEDDHTLPHNTDESVEPNLDDGVHNVAASDSKTGLYALCGVMLAGAVIALGVQLLASEDAPEATRVVTVDESYEAPTRTLKMPKAATVTRLREPAPEPPAEKVTNPLPIPVEVAPADFKAPASFPNTPPTGFWERDAEAHKKAAEARATRRRATSVKFDNLQDLGPGATDRRVGPAWDAQRTQARDDAIANALAGDQSPLALGEDDLSGRLVMKTPDRVIAQWHPDAGFILAQGKTLPCTLETAIQSALPGMTRCLVNHDVYSDDGRQLLVPRGSVAVGEYRGGLQRGVSRIFVLWTRLRTPGGLDLELASPATGELGESGLRADIDSHFMARFGGSALLSIIGGLSATQSGGSGDRYADTANSFSRSAEIALENSINIRPTAYLRQGTKIIIMVAQDLDFGPAMAHQRTGAAQRATPTGHQP